MVVVKEIVFVGSLREAFLVGKGERTMVNGLMRYVGCSSKRMDGRLRELEVEWTSCGKFEVDILCAASPVKRSLAWQELSRDTKAMPAG